MNRSAKARIAGALLVLWAAGPFTEIRGAIASDHLEVSGAGAKAASAGSPNVLFVLVDDLRFDVLSHEGYVVPTPSIDRLAAEGVRFSHAYVVNAMCAPSRASFLTGRYPHKHGVYGNSQRLQVRTIAEVLQPTHRTAMIGKWHLGLERRDFRPQPGWDRWFALPGQGEYTDPEFNVDGEWVQIEGYNTEILTEEAIRFIRESPRPFYVHLAFKGVHAPWTPAASDTGSLIGTEWPVRPNARHPRLPMRRRYQETLLSIDRALGTLLDVLDEEGIADETIVVFTSDNGILFGEHRRNDKRTFFEESIRIPLILRVPGLPGGQVREQVALNIDLYPTLLELLEYDVPTEDVDGMSLVPVMRTPTERTRLSWVYTYYRETQLPELSTMLALVTPGYKYVEFPDGPDMFCYFTGEPMLFDRVRGPFERNDLKGPRWQQLRARLAERLHGRLAELGVHWTPVAAEDVLERVRRLIETNPDFAARMAEFYPNGFSSFDDRVCPATYWD